MVKQLYADEHLYCPNYDKGEQPLIQEIEMERMELVQISSRVNKLIFVLDGQIEYSSGQVHAYPVPEGHICFLPAARRMNCRATKDSRLLIIRIYGEVRFCDCFTVENLYRMEGIRNKGRKSTQTTEPYMLAVNSLMKKYLDMLVICHRAGLRCRYYNEGKVKELMYILRAFYTKHELAAFFEPALAADARFSEMVINSYSSHGDLAGIATAMNYTVSGFEKKFRKVFGCSPYSWMLQQKAREAWHRVMEGKMNLKQVADSFGFSSPAAFGTFFRKHFGISPAKARENIKNTNKGAIEKKKSGK